MLMDKNQIANKQKEKSPIQTIQRQLVLTPQSIEPSKASSCSGEGEGLQQRSVFLFKHNNQSIQAILYLASLPHHK